VRTNAIYRSLNEEKTYGGVQRGIALANAAVLMLSVVALSWWWVVAPCLLFHVLMRYANKKDPQMMQVYFKYSSQALRYDPWPRVSGSAKGLRPSGFSRGQLC
jgi:type IV secretory pathway TrbD component